MQKLVIVRANEQHIRTKFVAGKDALSVSGTGKDEEGRLAGEIQNAHIFVP